MASPFEGIEKRAVIRFTPQAIASSNYHSLLEVPIDTWRAVLANTRVSILSRCRVGNEKVTTGKGWIAYLLSESSLFVDRDTVMIKTCGTTSLLLVLDSILFEVFGRDEHSPRDMQDMALFFTFSRLNFAFQEYQRYPHRSAGEETEFISKYFPSAEHLTLPMSCDSAFYASIFVSPTWKRSGSIRLNEALMTGVTEELSQLVGDLDSRLASGVVEYTSSECGKGRVVSGLTNWFQRCMDPANKMASTPSSGVADEFWFEPCGYSANALDGYGGYVNVHIAPEPETSYASIESYVPESSSHRHDLISVVDALEAKVVHFVSVEINPDETPFDPAVHNYRTTRNLIVSGEWFRVSVCRCERLYCPVLPDADKLSVVDGCKGIFSSTIHVGDENKDEAQRTPTSTTVDDDRSSEGEGDGPGPDSLSRSGNSGNSPDSLSRSLSHMVLDAGGSVASSCKTDVGQELLKVIESEQLDNPVVMVDIECIVKQWRRWQRLLPMIEPFYAVKCNDDPVLLKTLALLGANFDCASPAEMRAVLDIGQADTELIYSNPCKQRSGLQFAREVGVSLMVFDNEEELLKIAKYYSEAHLLLRIRTDDRDSQCPMSGKFGTPPPSWEPLIKKAAELNLNLVGVDFHVGSGCNRLGAFRQALSSARKFFTLAKQHGLNLSIVDVGGGFPGELEGIENMSSPSFEELAAEIRDMVELFPPEVRFISEPGRFFATASHTLAVNVFARRGPLFLHKESLMDEEVRNSCDSPRSPLNEDPQELGEDWKVATAHQNESQDERIFYYVNDGIYGSFNCLLYDHASVTPELLKLSGDASTHQNLHASNVFGPTCDGLDCILRDHMLPKMEVGDWLMFKNMGAYTVSAASNFNGFSKPQARYIRLAPNA
eukprot:GHVN01034142.1.p1 GENE.GHVN01034142.1~~GHVN01034142.1.p1  ORF type:complete len:887 (+),score=83.30 GHVN01034142.1:4763-7423(+)